MIMITKLTSGEELIADVTDENGTYISLDKPCVLQMIPSRSNPEQPTMALIPYAMYTESHRVAVKREHVIWSEEPLKELYNQYNSIFGSGIVVSQSPILS